MSNIVNLARLWPTYGVRAVPMTARLIAGKAVPFRSRGHTYVMPGGRSALYHLVESIDKLRRLAEYVRPDDRVIVDVGAHAGLFSAFALERASHAQVVMVEPEPQMQPIIERNARGRLVQTALSDRFGTATFHRAASSQESSLVESTIRSRHQPVNVPTTTLDEVCREFAAVDVLKIDVQGAEGLVLAGGSETLPKVRTLLIEVSFADPEPASVLTQLSADFGPGHMVNAIYAGADLVFER